MAAMTSDLWKCLCLGVIAGALVIALVHGFG